MSRFQIIFTGTLIVLAIAGALVFALSKSDQSETAVKVVMWGTMPSQIMNQFLGKGAEKFGNSVNVSYVEKEASTFESDLISALANGVGPDMILLSHDLLLKQVNKFYVIPLKNYSERFFKDSFIEAGEIFLTSSGVIGFPLSVDPMVMYWNRDIFSTALVPEPPKTWTEFFTLAPKITQKDGNGNITQSVIAFGEARNVTHFKDILSMLAIQAGTPIVGYDSNGSLGSLLSTKYGSIVPGNEALAYYTEFSNPLKASYSWNRSLSKDKSQFTAERLAVYFGYASELSSIRASNPNLNFDVAMVPQTGKKKATFANISAISILRSSKNVGASFTAATALTGKEMQTEWIGLTGYPPVRRDLLSTLPGEAHKSIFYQSALISKAWLDPNRELTTGIFGRMVENVTSGKFLVSESVSNASSELDDILTNPSI